MEGNRVCVFMRFPKNIDGSRRPGFWEQENDVVKFKQYLEAEVLPDGSVREHDLVQFWARRGGLRTVYAKDLVVIGPSPKDRSGDD